MRHHLALPDTCAIGLLPLLAALPSSACKVFDDELEKRIAPILARECTSHEDCSARADQPSACIEPDGRCVALRSASCETVTGALTPGALILGTMFSTSGPQAVTNIPRQQSAMLAVEQINAVGGVPGRGVAKRKLVLVSCDEAGDLDGSAHHLIDELKVPAIVGPNVSQDVIAVSTQYSVAAGTVLITPTGVASSIRDLDDDDLTWSMVPSDEQRAPLMKQQINQLETQLRAQIGRPIKLSIIYRDDALGRGSRVALNSLQLNGASLAENTSANAATVSIEAYDPNLPEQREIVARQLAFQPDIVVMAGLAEAITNILEPMEAGWQGDARPYYVLIDSLKIPEVLKAAHGNDPLRRRLRGTGIVPTQRSRAVYDAFRLDYMVRFPGSPSTTSGLGPAYDATFAIAYALTLTRNEPATGANVARGLRMLSAGGAEVPVQSTKVLAAFQHLSNGESIEALGTFAPLQWDDKGAPRGSLLEIWCVAGGSQASSFRGSGLFMDLQTEVVTGDYTQCEE